jgi:hypothetical protein
MGCPCSSGFFVFAVVMPVARFHENDRPGIAFIFFANVRGNLKDWNVLRQRKGAKLLKIITPLKR